MKNNKTVYLVIGLLTLVLSTASATFAYFTATAENNATITGNMASVTFDLSVTKMTTADNTPGLIPMSNSMVEVALTANAGNSGNKKGICVDDNGNAVCQIYKITVENTGTAAMLLDGYVTLTGGSGTPTDVVGTNNATTMRWSQAFCNETSGVVSNCTTVGKTTTTVSSTGTGLSTNWTAVTNTATTTDAGKNLAQVKPEATTTTISTNATIQGSSYNVINTNYIRISDHAANATYAQNSDKTSALVYNEFLEAQNETANPTGGSSATYTDSQVYYIVVWLSETGTNQTIATPDDRNDFFGGIVKFISAQGSEVTATFTGYSRVNPNTTILQPVPPTDVIEPPAQIIQPT